MDPIGGEGEKYHWPRERPYITGGKSRHLRETNHLYMTATAKEERVLPFFQNITAIIFIMGLDPTHVICT